MNESHRLWKKIKQNHFYHFFFFVSVSSSLLHVFAFSILSSKAQLGKGTYQPVVGLPLSWFRFTAISRLQVRGSIPLVSSDCHSLLGRCSSECGSGSGAGLQTKDYGVTSSETSFSLTIAKTSKCIILYFTKILAHSKLEKVTTDNLRSTKLEDFNFI